MKATAPLLVRNRDNVEVEVGGGKGEEKKQQQLKRNVPLLRNVVQSRSANLLVWAASHPAQLTLLLLLGYFAAYVVQADDDDDHYSLSVTGTGVITIPTTMASVSLGVEVSDKDAVRAQREVAVRASALVDALKKLKVDKLHTQSISLYPVYTNEMTAYGSYTNKLNGFRASNVVSFMVPADKAGEAIDAAVHAGANNVQSISLVANPEDMNGVQNKAIEAAIDHALQQGSVILRKLGCSFKGYSTVALNQGGFYNAAPMEASFAKMADASTPVLGGETQVSASVTLNLRYSDCSLALP